MSATQRTLPKYIHLHAIFVKFIARGIWVGNAHAAARPAIRIAGSQVQPLCSGLCAKMAAAGRWGRPCTFLLLCV